MRYMLMIGNMKFKLVDILFLLLAIIIFVWYISGYILPYRFDYDESDYMYAVDKGFIANYTDQHSISFYTFLKKGIESGKDEAKKTALSEYIRKTDDISFYRHYHGPMYFYYLVITKYFIGHSEYAMRCTTMGLHLLCFIAIYICCLWLFQNNSRQIALIASLMYITSVVNIESTSKITTHGFYVLTVILSLFALSDFIRRKKISSLYVSLLFLCTALFTLEYSVFLALTYLIVLFSFRKQLFLNWTKTEWRKFILKALGLCLIVFIVLWPGGLLKLTLIKNHIFLLYFTFIRQNVYTTLSFSEIWWQRIMQSPFEYCLLLATIVIVIYQMIRQKKHQSLAPFFIYFVLVSLTTLRNRSSYVQYISSLFPPLFIIASAVIVDYLKDKRRAMQYSISIILLLGLMVNNYFHHQTYRDKKRELARLDELVDYFQKYRLTTQAVLIPRLYVPTMHYYFQNAQLHSYEDITSLPKSLQKLSQVNIAGIVFESRSSDEWKSVIRDNHHTVPYLITQNMRTGEKIYFIKQ